jgi:hypothetical protein
MKEKIKNLISGLWKKKLLVFNCILGLLIISAIVYLYTPFGIGDSTQKAQASNITEMANKIYGDCHALQDWHECYKKEMAELTKNTGLPFAQSVLFSIQDADPNSRNCHVIAHYMAREAYHRDPTKWLELADQADINSCGGGFLHGILEAHIGDSPNQEINAVFADQICSRKPEDFRQRMCYHLFGHFFLVDQDGKLPEALPFCQKINTLYTYDCYDGLFMEDHQKLALSEHEIAPLPSYTPAYLQLIEKQCSQYSGTQSNACWTEIAEIVAKVYGYSDPQKIYQECYKASTDHDKQACYLKGVVILSIYVGYDTPEKLLSICSNYKNTNELYSQCNSYIISALMHYSVKYTDRGITLCSSIDPSYTHWCFAILGQQLKPLAPLDEREKLCLNAPADYKESCINR